MQLVLLDPADHSGAWQPFAGVRPVSELRAGAWRLRDRWERALGTRTAMVVSAGCAGFADVDSPPVVASLEIHSPTIVAASHFAPEPDRLTLAPGVKRLTSGGRTVAAIVSAGPAASALETASGPATEVEGIWLDGVPSLLDAIESLLPRDCAGAALQPAPAGSIILGDAQLVRAAPDTVEPGVVFDVRHGPVVVEAGAEVRSGTRLEGPCWIGAGARVVGGFVRRSVVGPRCVVRGELSSSVFLGYANKAHEGFVGHSVIGHWVNLGALTTTSNLKNTYGDIRLDLPSGRLDTGRQFLGSLVADHAKTAIGTMLGTGTVIGVGANVFGADRPPRWVPPFAWGVNGSERMTAEGFLQVARRVMPRRDVTVSADMIDWLSRMHQRLA